MILGRILKKSIQNTVHSLLLGCAFIIGNACTHNVEEKSPCEWYDYDIVNHLDANNAFAVAENNKVATVVLDETAKSGIKKVVNLFQGDIEAVTGLRSELKTKITKNDKRIIIVGEIDNCVFLKELESNNKVDFSEVRGKWENSLIQTVENPFPGVEEALLIVGSDKRGVIYGMMELSRQMGISPWTWWADVPVQKQTDIFIKKGHYNFGEPKVKYRGIFINDEEPALGPWVRESFGGFNAQFYEKVFELILRMKGNYLWPAMWGKAFADDDPMNAVLADELGIVIGYSHHEPMMRAHKEWKKYGSGAWNYTINKNNLQDFWREGVKRNLGKESVITVGMRGDGDEPMSEESNIELLQQIVKDQRKIIAEETGKPASETPQVWALYKEVQEYYDNGMRVDDDVILLYCDDNWGNVRRLPGEKERTRKGGSGLYYHFDYVGGPRSYKWLNTNPLPKIWEQNKLAYEYGVDKLWVVNVGDIKPMELPIQFYLDLAWNPDKIGIKELDSYTENWAKQQFGCANYKQIGAILKKYGKIAGRRKPELINMKTFSLHNYREFETVTNELNSLFIRVCEVEKELKKGYKDAYYQLVKYPVEALANLYNLYNAQAKNHFYFEQNRMMTNLMADSVEYYFKKDSILTEEYHYELSNGKWNHMMAETKIGYTSWNSPPRDIMPDVKRIIVEKEAAPGIFIEGALECVEGATAFPDFDAFNKQNYFFEIYNKGSEAFNYKAKPSVNWINLSSKEGEIINQQRIYVSIDWEMMPAGKAKELVDVTAGNVMFKIDVNTYKPSPEELKSFKGYVESNGYIAFEAAGYDKHYTSNGTQWIIIPDIGLTGDGVTAYSRLSSNKQVNQSLLEYNVCFKDTGKVKVYAYFSPTLTYKRTEALQYAVSFNNDKPVVQNAYDNSQKYKWSKMVSGNINVSVSEHMIHNSGNNILKYHMVSPGLVLQKIVIDTGGLKKTYLGPQVCSSHIK